MIAGVCSLFAGLLAAGGLLVAASLCLLHRLPPGFLRFCASASALLAALAGLLGNDAARWVWGALAVVALAWYGWLRAKPAGNRGVSLGVAIAAASTPLVWTQLSAAERDAVAVAGSTSSALLLGTVTVTMILGHWYLVDTELPIAPLRDGARWLCVAVGLRMAVVGLALGLGGWEILRIERFADVIFSTNALFFLFRSLVGLGAPVLLAGLIWQTVKIRSTQSATGLLYVALIVILFGELISHFLFLRTGFPL